MRQICKLRVAGWELILVSSLLAGCAVGPNFKRPDAPPVNSYTSSPLETTTSTPDIAGGEAQRFVEGLEIPAKWWDLFHSKPLNDLIERSLTNNPDLKAAQAALLVARENVRVQRAAYYPSIAGAFSASRQRQSETLAPTPNENIFQYSLFTPEVSVSYVPDVFGLTRRTVESSQAQAQGVRYQMIATYLTLSANVVVAAVQEASLRAQVETTRELIDS